VRATRPALAGEILFDRYTDGSAVLGGAPVNVAVHLAGLGERPLLLGRVGDDEAGREARARLERLGLDLAGVQVDSSAPTGEVRVEVVDGEPRFDIAPDCAWDALDGERAATALAASGASILYHGVLAARSLGGRRALDRLRATGTASIFVDVNLRPPWTPLARARELCRGAAWIKLNEAELARLSGRAAPGDGAQRAADALALAAGTGGDALVAVTRGALGAELHGAAGRLASAPAAPLAGEAPVDPVGAGDAFAAVLLLAALRGWPPTLALGRAAELAAAICGIRGALPDDPGFHDSFRRAWEAA